MKFQDALKQVNSLAESNVILFTKNDLGVIFQEHSDTLNSTIKRLLKYETIKKIVNGIYMNNQVKPTENMLYKISELLRPSDINYLSNESVLSNLSIISQQMLDRITVMTTGRSGEFKTPFGVIEFTHTKRNWLSIIKNTRRIKGMAIRIADKDVALRDLKRIGRNINMIDWEEFYEAE